MDYTDEVKATAIKVSYPCLPDGSRDLNTTRLGDRLDIDATTTESRTLRNESIEIAKTANNSVPPRDINTWYAHCSRWIAPIVIKHIDPRFPGDWTKYQLAHLRDPQNGWVRMGATLPTYKPGDVIITDEWHPSGHVVLFVGDHAGYPDMVTEASWGGIIKETGKMHPASKLGGLRRLSHTMDDQGRDTSGRQYSVWRYYGPEITSMMSEGYSLEDAYYLTKVAPHPDHTVRDLLKDQLLDDDLRRDSDLIT